MNAERDLRAEANRLKAATPIANVIGETLTLRRQGRLLIACCPFHKERTPSFFVYTDHYYCFGCGQHGDTITWLMRGRGMAFAEALTDLGKISKPSRPHQTPPSPSPITRERSRTADIFLRCWSQGVTSTGSAVETYLRNRGGLTVPNGASIRFHPRCQRGSRDLPGGPDYWPAMLGLMTDPLTHQPVGVHRTFILPDGSGKAPEVTRGNEKLKAKSILGTWGVVRLAPDDEIDRALAISEGIENAMTAQQLIGWGRAVCAVGSADEIRKFPVLPYIEGLTIFADADDSGVGLRAARECAARWTRASRDALIHMPAVGEDWNDAARRIIP